MSEEKHQLEDCVKICEKIILDNKYEEWNEFTRDVYDPKKVQEYKEEQKKESIGQLEDKRQFKFLNFTVNHFMIAIISMNLHSIGAYESKKHNTRKDT